MQHSNSIKRFDHLFKVNPNLEVENQNGKAQMLDRPSMMVQLEFGHEPFREEIFHVDYLTLSKEFATNAILKIAQEGTIAWSKY